MRRWLFAVILLAGALALAACAGEEKATPAPTSAAQATPAAWEQEWDQVLAAAKREGKVAVAGPTGTDERRALTEPFQQKYGISVEYFGFAGPEFPTRLRSEREAGQYLWDVIMTGTTTFITSLKPMQVLDPVESTLILPEVKELKNWREGRFWYGDKDRLTIAFTPQTRPSLFINTNMAKADEFKSYRDLLDPKWKGKILVGRDPRVAGPGQATFTLFYRHPNLGPDFIRALLRQDLALLRDDREAAEWLAQGKYPILLGVADRFAIDLRNQGLPVLVVDPRQMKEGGDVSPANGVVGLANRAAHPNAAKVYINWLLSKEGQTAFSKATNRPSWRVDVPTDHLDPWVIARPDYVSSADEEAMAVKDPLGALLQELLGR